MFEYINLRQLEPKEKSKFLMTTGIDLGKQYLIKTIQQNSHAKEIQTLQNKKAFGLG